MHCIKWICSSQPFETIESIAVTRMNLGISTFQSSMPSLTIRSSFACLEPRTGLIPPRWKLRTNGSLRSIFHFSRTNKHADFQEQIIRHSTRQTNAMAMEELILHGQTKPVTAADDQLEAKVTRPSRPLNLVQYGWKAAKSGGSNDRITAGQLDQVIQIGGLLDALVVFVRECRNKEDGVVVPPYLMDRRERDASWVKSIGVQVHGSITCWKPDGKDSNDLQKLTEEFVRCSPNWQGKKLWRRDYVWMQE